MARFGTTGINNIQTVATRGFLNDRFRLREVCYATFIIVAVGTLITERPPHRSVRARLRIRLLRGMSGVKASVGVGVQNAGWRNPPVQDLGKTFPTHPCALAAADQNTLP